MVSPPIRDGAVVFDSEIVAGVGTGPAMRSRFPDAEVVELGESIVLPGLVNAHTHLELSDVTRGDSPQRFVDWVLQLMQSAPQTDPAAAAIHGAAESLRFGVTTVGDITAFPAATRPALAKTPLNVVSYGEVRAMATRRTFLESRIAAAVSASFEVSGGSSRIKPGISPHAPYSIEAEGYRRCLAAARAHDLPLATHLAETPDEGVFLAEHGGTLREIWEFLGAWDDAVPRFAGGSVRFAEAAGLLSYPTLLAHVNYCDDDELAMLAAGAASVAYCPRTHAFFFSAHAAPVARHAGGRR